MANSVTIEMWNFDPGFAYGPFEGLPPEWSEENGEGLPANVVTSGPAIDLTPYVVSVTITDTDSDGLITGNGNDAFTISGIEYTINAVWFGDKMTVNGTEYTSVTFYGHDEFGNVQSLAMPMVDGAPVAAFPGDITGTVWIEIPNAYALPITDIPCFTRGTRIETAVGEVNVEDLKVGDLVMTKDKGLQPIRWIGSRFIERSSLAANRDLRPIRVSKGALGNNNPTRDLLVSPQHRILVRSKVAQRMFDVGEVLVAAKQLLEVVGIDVDNEVEEVEYFHFLLDEHHVVISNGAESESLYTGPRALRSVGRAALEEIYTTFPELRESDPEMVTVGARLFLTGSEGRKLAKRHARNRKALVM